MLVPEKPEIPYRADNDRGKRARRDVSIIVGGCGKKNSGVPVGSIFLSENSQRETFGQVGRTSPGNQLEAISCRRARSEWEDPVQPWMRVI